MLLVLGGAKAAELVLRLRDSRRERQLAAELRRRALRAGAYARPVEDNA